MYAQLLIDLFKYLAPFLRNVELTKPMQILYKVKNIYQLIDAIFNQSLKTELNWNGKHTLAFTVLSWNIS